MDVGISLQGVSLSVPIYVQRERRTRGWTQMLLGAALDPPKRRFTEILKDISFELCPGDRVAILGRNGAGKSTLLRVLNGVYVPTAGSLSVRGSCQALLNISLGLNGEATVRENIYLRGTAMGLRAADLREHVEPILDFADLHEKATHRLRTLSAGQRMRLGFAISTAFQHDIMLMDEWLGAGDNDFVTKAKGRLQGRMKDSKIVALASHSTGLLREICNRALVIERGCLVFDGDMQEGLQFYHDLQSKLRASGDGDARAFGPAPTAFGCVESLAFDGRELKLVGWMVDTEGGLPNGLRVDVDGVVSSALRLVRTDRPDVRRHMSLADDACGFVATFEFPEFGPLVGNGAQIVVFGGDSPAAEGQLRIAAMVSQQMRSIKTSPLQP